MKTERKTPYNSTYKKLAVQRLNEVLSFVSSSVVADSFRLRNRQLLVAAKRWWQANDDTPLQQKNVLRMGKIDIAFDFRGESKGRDPDRWSPTLQEYHRIVWNKLLPNGKELTLNKISQNRLYHKSELGEFHLSSDMAFYGFIRKCHRTEFIVSQVSESEIRKFEQLTLNTLGGTMIWPSIRIDNKMTINGARGFNRLIGDRLDLTMECVRRYYLGEESPLHQVFKRYSSFFTLFDNFSGFTDFFLLQDFINENKLVKFALPFDEFESPSWPRSLSDYMQYRMNTIALVNKRNLRILESVSRMHVANQVPP